MHIYSECNPQIFKEQLIFNVELFNLPHKRFCITTHAPKQNPNEISYRNSSNFLFFLKTDLLQNSLKMEKSFPVRFINDV